jgi:hypothetical protein
VVPLFTTAKSIPTLPFRGKHPGAYCEPTFLNVLILLNIHKSLRLTQLPLRFSDFCFERSLDAPEQIRQNPNVNDRLENGKLAFGWWRWELRQRPRRG